MVVNSSNPKEVTIKCTGRFKIDTKKMDLNAFINVIPIQHRCAVHMIQISNLETYYPRKVENQKDSDG